MTGRILVLEPDPQKRRALELDLAAQGHEIACAEEVSAALRARQVAEHDLERGGARRPVVAASPPMISLLEALEHLAADDHPVLLVGEPGTGKESLARVLHASSPRRLGAFVALDARTFTVGSADAGPALAEGGTLFLEDVDALPPARQRDLLRLLRTGELRTEEDGKPRPVSIRVVAAASAPLADGVARGAFDGDLARELGRALRVPALRDRREDLPLLLDHFLARAARRFERPPPALSAEALGRLVDHAWPGNLRELESAMVRAALRSVAGLLTPHELPGEIARETSSGASDLALKPARKDFEADWIRRALHAAGGNRTHAARLLEISHRALLYKLKEFGITG